MKQSLSYTKQPNRFDFGFLAILIGLMLISFVSIYSAFNLMTQNGTAILIQQIIWYSLGFIVMGIIMFFGNDTIMQNIKRIYYILIVCLVYLLLSKYIIAGITLGGVKE